MCDFVITCKSQKSTTCNKELKLDRSITRETKDQNGNELKHKQRHHVQQTKKCNSWKKKSER